MHRPPTRPLLHGTLQAILPAVLLAVAAAAQAPRAWSTLQLPGGVPAGGVQSLGKLVHVVHGGQLHVWSACTRRWQQMPVGAGAVLRNTNDWLLAQDGATWTAFGASRGRFAPLPVAAGAVVHNPSSQQNDSVLFVQDGNRLHAFSGLVGRWVSRPVSPAARTAVQRHVGLLADGTLLAGFDAYEGRWHDLQIAGPVVQLHADGTVGVATTPTGVHGFSALRGTWTSAPAPAGATAAFGGDDWRAFYDGVEVLAFSGLRGAFASAIVGPGATAHTEDVFGLFAASGRAHGYSAITGGWTAIAAGGANVLTSGAVALLDEGPQRIAFSAPLGAFVPIALAGGSADLGGCVVAVTDAANVPVLFSALTGNWHAAPNDALPMLPMVGTTSALLPTATGFRAFSARTGAFVPLSATAGIPAIGTATAPCVVSTATDLHCFDARRDVWLREPRSGPGVLNPQVWRTTVLAIDGTDAIGYGTQAGAIERTALGGPPVAFRASSESSTVVTGNAVHAHSALPLPASLVQFPGFRRVFARGATFRLHLRLLPGEVAFLAGGLQAPSPVPVPGLGELLLDPQALATVLLLPEPDADRAAFALPVPDVPALAGQRLWFQALVLPPGGRAWLTEGSELWIG